ncbi:tetratricopeptide repeat-containing serine/threonine protein kinase [Luteimonas sp. BDR2-5]|uniref:serine/threonine-protein kinase n=1 Tax=Proluteimonas luteida TaxID=2878685 RepID=UPI001E5EB5B7|nr:serine/threonine-protein kinase [Luteimonas sp. BDR2-5]MCD9027246.1 tetratricopeptide repeat-containing serine/threonine protein kinase [Luteimonas sp. BDR2-5]
MTGSGPTADPGARWQRLAALFDAAIELEGDARKAYVAAACGEDAGLRNELEAMLAADAAAAIVDRGVIDVVDIDSLAASPAPDAGNDGSGAIGARIGPYRLDAVLGRGGMGMVYAASRVDGAFEQRVAIKRLRLRWEGRTLAERFLLERRILASLSHPHIARLLDGGIDDDGQPWFAMEYIDGAPLTAWADARTLDLRQRIALFGQACEAVQYAHAHFVVHRDLKPDNILVDADGGARVLDFGVAKLADPLAEATTRTGVAVGFTPEYAAPEQITGGAISAATDVYALGLVLYELLTGRLPYDLAEHDLQARVAAISERAPMRPEQAITSGEPQQVDARLRQRRIDAGSFRRFVRGDLTRILQTALAKEPQRRYASVQAMADDLGRFLEGRPVSVAGDTFGYRARRFVGRNRWGVAMASVAALALLAGGVGIVVQSREVRAQRDAALVEASRANAVREYVMLMFGDAAQRDTSGTLTARDVLGNGAEAVFKRFQDQPENGRAALLMLAELYVQIGDFEGAVPLLERMLAWQPESQDPATLADARNLLANAVFQRGDPGRAGELLAQAQTFWSANPETYRLRLLESRSLQSMLERTEGKPEQGVATLRAALADSIRLRGPSDSDTMKIYNNLANALLQTGHPQEALAVADEGWAIAVDADRHRSDFGIALMNIRGVTHAHLRHMDEAQSIFAEAVDLQRALYGPSLQLAAMLQNLGNLQGLTGRPEAAAESFRESITMADQFAGPSNQTSLVSRFLLAEALAATGEVAAADAELAPVMEKIRSQFGEQHILTALSYRARANVRLAQGRTADAGRDLAQAQRILESLGPPGVSHLANLAKLRERIEAAGQAATASTRTGGPSG